MNDRSPPPTKSQAMEQVASQMTGPLTRDEFIRRVLAIWPSQAKDPAAGIKQALQYEFLGHSLILQEDYTLIPLRLAMPGVRFRIALTRQEINRGWLFFFPGFQFMAASNLTPENFVLEDMQGHALPVKPVPVRTKVQTLFGVEAEVQTAFDLQGWYRKQGLRRGDSLLVTVLDWEQGRYRLAPEPARVRRKHQSAIQTHNQALAEHLFGQLEAARDEYVWGRIAVPTAYLQLKAVHPYPSDHWLAVVDQDPRLRWDGYELRYGDWISPLESMFRDRRGEPKSQHRARRRPLSKSAAQRIYRFKAALWHNKRLWRRIEIQGGQTLAELDGVLRTVFQHDHSDHLSGFWKLVRRGQTRRFREVDLGTINPFGGGDGEGLQVASLALTPGEALKYVYDFGDWVKHRLTLEAITDPEEQVTYPRITGQNKPRYQDCQLCHEAGQKSLATWICYPCSEAQQSDFLLCETCMAAHVDDHYLEELLY